MDAKTKRCIFLRYGETTKGFQYFRLSDEEKRRILYRGNVVFNEINSSRNQINGMNNEEVVNMPAAEIESQHKNGVYDVPETTNHKRERPRREIKFSDHYGKWIYVAQEDLDPKSVEEVFSIVAKNEWVKAIKKEIDWLDRNNVWDVVELPKGCKAVGSKWIYKRKHDADGKVEQHKV